VSKHTPGEGAANAALISAAPDLLAATQWAADIIQRPEDMWDEEGLPTEEMERFAAFIDYTINKAGGAK